MIETETVNSIPMKRPRCARTRREPGANRIGKKETDLILNGGFQRCSWNLRPNGARPILIDRAQPFVLNPPLHFNFVRTTEKCE